MRRKFVDPYRSFNVFTSRTTHIDRLMYERVVRLCCWRVWYERITRLVHKQQGITRPTKKHSTKCSNNESVCCSKGSAQSARHTTMPADKTQESLMRFTNGQHDQRRHLTIHAGHTIREYIIRSLRIVQNDKFHHGLKDTQMVQKVSLITCMDRQHDHSTRECKRRLTR